jgi:hypothetical protein
MQTVSDSRAMPAVVRAKVDADIAIARARQDGGQLAQKQAAQRPETTADKSEDLGDLPLQQARRGSMASAAGLLCRLDLAAALCTALLKLHWRRHRSAEPRGGCVRPSSCALCAACLKQHEH